MRNMPGTLILSRDKGGPKVGPSRQVIGMAGDGENDNVYEVCIGAPRKAPPGEYPIIFSRKTGNYFILDWPEIVMLANLKGLNGFECAKCKGTANCNPDGSPPDRWQMFPSEIGLKWFCWKCQEELGIAPPPSHPGLRLVE